MKRLHDERIDYSSFLGILLRSLWDSQLKIEMRDKEKDDVVETMVSNNN